MRLWQRALGAVTGLIAAGALAPAAMAITTQAQTNQAAGTSAGGFHDLGLDLTFSGDTPHNLTINLPPGLLANASKTTTTGAPCIATPASSTPNSGCQVGSAMVFAQELNVLGIPVGLTVPVQFYLVKPPVASDLAGLEVYTSTLGLGQLGPTGDVYIRPSGDPLGVGATIKLQVPNSADGLPITITEINSTLSQLRYPTTCPATPQRITGSVDGYSSGAVAYSAALNVSGCSALPYAPKVSATAARDANDAGVAVTSTITQGATEAPNRNVALTFPAPDTTRPNLNALGNLCRGDVSGCKAVGSVTAASPLYPAPLTGAAYLTGSTSGLSLTLKFPSPFPLTLVGAVALGSGSASFTGLPDIPLTNLKVALNGGPTALFVSDCLKPTGTVTTSLLDQNGDKSAKPSATLTVAGCPAVKGGGGTGGGGGAGGGSGSSGGGGGGGTAVTPTSTAKIVSKSISGLAKGKPSLRFRVRVGSKAAKMTRLTVSMPKGLSIVRHRVGKKHKTLKVTGVSLKGAKVKSLALSHKRLVITFKKASRNVLVTLGPKSLKETKALATSARKRTLKRLTFKVIARNTKKKNKTITVRLTKFTL